MGLISICLLKSIPAIFTVAQCLFDKLDLVDNDQVNACFSLNLRIKVSVGGTQTHDAESHSLLPNQHHHSKARTWRCKALDF